MRLLWLMERYNLHAADVLMLDMVADGLENEEAAAKMGLKIGTFKSRMGRVAKIIGTGDRAGMIGWCYRKQMFERVLSDPVTLTRREFDVLVGVTRGMSNAELALDLDVSQNTVRTHLTRLYGVLDARGREHAVRRGVDTGAIRLVQRVEGQ